MWDILRVSKLNSHDSQINSVVSVPSAEKGLEWILDNVIPAIIEATGLSFNPSEYITIKMRWALLGGAIQDQKPYGVSLRAGSDSNSLALRVIELDILDIEVPVEYHIVEIGAWKKEIRVKKAPISSQKPQKQPDKVSPQKQEKLPATKAPKKKATKRAVKKPVKKAITKKKSPQPEEKGKKTVSTESLPAGLTWTTFKKAYKSQQGDIIISAEEYSAEWKRYKEQPT